MSLKAPIALNQPSAVSSHRGQESLSSEEPNRPSDPGGILAIHTQLDVHDSEGEERAHGVVQDRTVGAVELGNGGKTEAEGHVFEKVGLRAGLDKELVIPFGAEILFFLDAVKAYAIGEVDQVCGEWESPSASDCCDSVSEWLP